jgi:hypothetical protein
LTLHHDLLNSILSKIWKLSLLLLINLKIHLELIHDGLESRPKWPVLLLNLNAFHWAGLALWVLPSIYYPYRWSNWGDLVRVNLLADSLLVVGHSLLFWELGWWAGEVLGVEELLEFFAVWEFHSGFRLWVETEEDRAALLSSADADDLNGIVLCY